MARIAEATIDLSANSARLRTDLAKSRNEVRRWAGQVQRDLHGLTAGFRAVTSVAAGFGVALGARSIFNFVKSSIDAAGGLGELAEQLGVSTRALQVYQFAAAQTGVKQAELETGLMTLNRSIGDAANGSKEQADAFREMGVAVTDANGKTRTAEAVQRDIADAYVNTADKTRFLAHFQDVAGRSAQRLAPLLAQGSAGLDEYARQAEAAGAMLSDEMAVGAARASDSIARLSKSIEGLKLQLGGLLAPAGGGIADAFTLLLSGFSDTNLVIEKLQIDLARLEGDNLFGISAGASRIEKQRAYLDQLLELRREAARGRALSGLSVTAPAAIAAPPIDTKAAEQLDKFIDNLAHERDQLLRSAEAQELYNNLRRAGTEFDSAGGHAVQVLTAQIQRNRAAVDELNAGLDAETAATARWIEELKKAHVAQADILDGHERMKRQAEEARSVGRDLGLTFTSAFEDMVIAGAKVQDMLRGIVVDLQRLALRKTVTEPLLGLFGDVLSGGLSGLFGGAAIPLPNLGNVANGMIGHAAAGGHISGPTIVGENGKELFVPDRAGTVIPNNALGGPTIFIDARGADAAGLRRLERLVAALNGSIEPRAVAAVSGSWGRDRGRWQ